MSKTGKRIIKGVVLTVAAAAVALTAGAAAAHPTPAAHHALADGGLLSSN